MFWIITIIVLLGAFIANMFSGGGSPRAVREIFFGNYYADKGVLREGDVPNARETLQRCIDQGFGIKADVQLTADRKLVVCSDTNLEKNFGKDIDINLASSEEVMACGIITLEELFSMDEGKVPLILELKTGPQNDILCRFVADAIYAYEHKNVAVASFHSGIIAWFKHTEKHIFRGLISAPSKDFKSLPGIDRFMVGNLANNSVCRPHFALYRKGPQSIFVKFAFYLGLVQGVWTTTDKAEAAAFEDKKDMIVFSGFIPEKAHYRDLPVREKSSVELEAEQKDAEKLERRKARLELERQSKPRHDISYYVDDDDTQPLGEGEEKSVDDDNTQSVGESEEKPVGNGDTPLKKG
ncbi:MAG: hypothetical protein RR198_03985 [Oscillospiraceae bacterium]